MGLDPYTKYKITLIRHTTNPVIKYKAGLLNLAEELSNVSKRDMLYCYHKLTDEGGVDALIRT